LNYVYDFENHLVRQGGATFVYDGDGNRVQKIVAGNVTNYFVDTVNPTGYAQVLAEETSTNFALTNYTWGLDLVSRVDFSSGQPIYFVHDGHGSVRALTNPGGGVTDTYDYDAFGNLIHSTGTTANNYLFAGEQFDPNLNLYYNRARYLSTNTGRFWTTDTHEGDSKSPASLQKYLYAEDDPIDHVDPTGHQVVVVVTVAIAALAAVGTLAYLHYHPRPFRIGLFWNNDFIWKNENHQKLSSEGALTSQEVEVVKQNALDALRAAYGSFGGNVVEGKLGPADHTIEVTDSLTSGCGATRQSPAYYSFVSYDCVMNRAQFALQNHERENVIPAIGLGIGNIGAHEVGHQIALSTVNKDLDLPGFYDNGNDSDPTVYDGTPQQWTGKSLEELPSKVRPFF
jgi:RHS repeat-associated protein